MQDEKLALVSRYLQAIAAHADLGAFLHPEVVYEELPNRVVPQGARCDLAAMRAAAERGKQVLRSQSFELLGGFAAGERVLAEVAWTGVLDVALGTRAPGDALHARCAMVFELRDGRIVAQRNYDCYEPF